ncbi:hypothetical protein A176_006348 [Myxococcus hansupus]|uniref:Lipoprotein n=1 Tax=Pseudomyxococcus hansupus TaxID=1297742 RepID=A0A0H4X179_9BACT|nr:hypothetical protein [Myxococcus hansupus]AKQ69436.1 hypothetical protein A176_006348 [Myxococcus hansupus]
MRIQAALVAVLLMACGGGEELDEDVFVVRFEASYGECQGSCYFRLEISSDGASHVAYAERKGMRESRKAFLLSQFELNGLLKDVTRARADAWEPVYGCPDCVDQGSYGLTLAGTEELRQSSVDPKVIPAHLAPLIQRMYRTLRVNLS